MTYLKVDLKNMETTKQKIQRALSEQKAKMVTLKNKPEVRQGNAKKTRTIYVS